MSGQMRNEYLTKESLFATVNAEIKVLCFPFLMMMFDY